MRVIYADPFLRDTDGPPAAFCRAVKAGLEHQGIPVLVLGAVGMSPEAHSEFHATALFHDSQPWKSDGDPLSGWLNTFNRFGGQTLDDLSRLQGALPDDLVYVVVPDAPRLVALIRWFQAIAADRRPHVVAVMSGEAGVDVNQDAGADKATVHTRDYRIDPRPMFYRYATASLTESDLSRFHLAALDPLQARVFGHVLNQPVDVLPTPAQARAVATSRVGRRPLTVAVLGPQTPDTGFALLPLIARLLLALEPDLRLLVHNSTPDAMPRVLAEMRAHAAVDDRVTVEEGPADADRWTSLLHRTGLLLCPCDPVWVQSSYPALAGEALANAIPLIVPGGSALSALLGAFGNPGACFAAAAPTPIVAAIRQAVADYDGLAARAVTAAAQWAETMTGPRMAKTLIAYGQRT